MYELEWAIFMTVFQFVFVGWWLRHQWINRSSNNGR